MVLYIWMIPALLGLIIFYEIIVSPRQYKKFEKELAVNQGLRMKDFIVLVFHLPSLSRLDERDARS